MAILNFLAYSAVWLAAIAMVGASAVFPLLMVKTRRAYMRELAPPPVPAGPPPLDPVIASVLSAPPLDPDIAWALADDPDPAAVARLSEVLARPLADLIAEGERKAIAMRYPLKGNPAEATVVLPPAPEPVISVGPGEGVCYVETTAIGDRERSFLPAGSTYTHFTGGSVPVSGGGGGGSNSINTYIAPQGVVTANEDAWRATSGKREPEVLARLREQRLHYWTRAHHLANHACVANRAFTDPEGWEWQQLMEQVESLDRRIMAILIVLDKSR